ncbi:MAG: trehalase, partial [Proteobacteria bacterium]
TSDAVGKLPIDEHIAKLWKELSRKPDVGVEDVSSLIPLPFAYVVPGGRFREIYYWDSYFTQLGLLADGEDEIFKGMVQNFSHLLQATGRIPNGNRDYYRGRSQPPFFSLMISLWQERYGQQSALAFLPVLKTEHTFWMTGSRAVKVGETEVLNRYWDDRAAPRPEAYKEDVKLAKHAEAKLKRSPSDVFRDLRAGAESGWDFGTRWFRDSNEFATISTTEFLPVDLNCLIYQLETKIAELSALNGDEAEASRFRDLAAQRKALIQTYFWNSKSGTFRDYDLKNRAVSGEDTLAMLMPLFVGVATEVQAKSVEKVLTAKFLKAGGLVTTLKMSGHQWDSPNGWAPLQWLGYAGLQRYGLVKTASLIQKRWLALNEKVYQSTGKMMEKYDVIDLKKVSGGGEYPNQDGFGWTNGVYKALKNSKASLRHLGFQHEVDKP